jgi:hypothetical protein
MTAKGNRRGLPPHRMLLEEAFGHLASTLVLRRVRELLVVTKYDDCGPLPVRRELVALEAHQRIRSHPFDFAAKRGVPVQKLAVQVDPQRNNVRLVVPGTRQAEDVAPCQHPPAFPSRHLLYQHSNGLRHHHAHTDPDVSERLPLPGKERAEQKRLQVAVLTLSATGHSRAAVTIPRRHRVTPTAAR